MPSGDVLRRIRRICRSLPETDEGAPFGHPWFRVRGKMFASFYEQDGDPCLVVKVGKEAMSLFLADPRFFQAAYVGKHGWVVLRIQDTPDWEEIESLLRDSYEKVRGRRNLPRTRA